MKIVPRLVVTAGLLVAVPASALPTQSMFQATIGGVPVGGLVFALDQEVEGGCRYALQWSQGRVPSEQCFVDEMVPPSRGGCFEAATMPIATIITLPPPGVPCQGIDDDGQSTPIYALSAGERGTDGSLSGVIQLDSASTVYLTFTASPAR